MKVIVVSHGSYARGLVDTAQMIAGEQEDLEAVGLEPEDKGDTWMGRKYERSGLWKAV